MIAAPRLTLFDRHPLAGELKHVRGGYCTMLAQALAMDGPPTPARCTSFYHLVEALSLNPDRGVEYLRTCDAINRQGSLSFLERLEEKFWLDSIYRLDLAWLHTADGDLPLRSQLNMERICQALDKPHENYNALHNLHGFMLSLRRGARSEILWELERTSSRVTISPNTWVCALAAGMRRLELRVDINNIPPSDERPYHVRWLTSLGRRLCAGQVFAALIKTDPELPASIPRIHPDEERDNRWDDQAPFHPLYAPCDGMLVEGCKGDGEKLEHGSKVGVFYGFPPEGCQHPFHRLDDPLISDIGAALFYMEIKRIQSDSWRKAQTRRLHRKFLTQIE